MTRDCKVPSTSSLQAISVFALTDARYAVSTVSKSLPAVSTRSGPVKLATYLNHTVWPFCKDLGAGLEGVRLQDCAGSFGFEVPNVVFSARDVGRAVITVADAISSFGGTTLVMLVESNAEELAAPVSVRKTAFTCGDVADGFTFTVTVIGG